jgi:DNA sulfur modification protein DndC
MIWTALSTLNPDQLAKPLYIISSDTLVETPKIMDYIDSSLGRMNEAARKQGLPFTAHKVRPVLEDSFWVNLIGRGYPAPSQRFRWCTDRLKIQPANRFILDKVAEHGEVVVVLGVRKSESSTRAQVMSLHRIKGSPLSRHSTLPNA